MAVDRYYTLFRKERHKYRKRMLAALRKRGFSDEDLLRIVDAVAGRTESGKETAAKEILSLLSDGSDRQAVFSYLDSLQCQFFEKSE